MKKISYIFLIILSLILFAQQAEALLWTTKAPAPDPGRCQIQGHGNVRDTIYICGGRAPGAVAIRTMHAYVPGTNTWITSLPPMPGPRSHGCGDVIDSIIYAVGGFDSSATAQPTVYAFNANRKSWATRTAMPRAIFLIAGASYGGRLYVFGSQNRGDTLFEYNPGTNSWMTRVPGTRPPGRRAAVAAGTQSYLYIMGGQDRSNAILRDCWRYERRTGGVWTRMADMPGPRIMHAAYTVAGDSVIYVVGGNPTSFGGPCDSIVYKYTIASNSWATETPMLTSRGFLTLDQSGNKIYAICGINGGSYFTTNEEGGPGVTVAENHLRILTEKFKIAPNPTHGISTITYSLVKRSKVSLKIYNAAGATKKILVNGIVEPGSKNINFNGSNLPNGVYFCELTINGYSETSKILIIK